MAVVQLVRSLVGQLVAPAAALVVAYWIGRVIYNFKFHQLSKYPGPRLAAISDLCLSGRYPWLIEDALARYGDVVRIAPNELVFISPQAAQDIYLAQEKSLEKFVQVGYDALDTGDGGISGEANPERHREVAKKLAPAFSARNFKAKEGTIHKHLDFFVERMKEFGGDGQPIEMQRWSDWLALDMSADLTYGRDMGQVRDSKPVQRNRDMFQMLMIESPDAVKDSLFMSSALKLNLFVTMSQVVRKFRSGLFALLPYFTIPPKVWPAMPFLIRMNSEIVQDRIGRRGELDHLDYFEQLIPSDAKTPVPDDKKHLFHLENVAGNLLLASWQPLANQFYSLIFFLLREPGLHAYKALVQEVRTGFADYKSIDTETLSTSKFRYLQACVSESLRLHQESMDGLPRISPGAVVDGQYVPKGVTCQISYFAATRSDRFFTEPREFRPERWLSNNPKHPLFDGRFKDDNLKVSRPFSQGLRGCPGGVISQNVIRLFIAKVLWQFDLEAAPGIEDLSFDKDFKFLTFWERPQFWIRFKPVCKGD
ncbi:cytochrome P450 [Diaporthe helianthi]|uniref:Cytochrome P450 n=1 Tax=Diaporthe helianthi TaxID=158607 RepID=A0A2P5HWI3_DIAHE|nr:cytochrome P450 [Diaporthe helianthi]